MCHPYSHPPFDNHTIELSQFPLILAPITRINICFFNLLQTNYLQIIYLLIISIYKRAIYLELFELQSLCFFSHYRIYIQIQAYSFKHNCDFRPTCLESCFAYRLQLIQKRILIDYMHMYVFAHICHLVCIISHYLLDYAWSPRSESCGV